MPTGRSYTSYDVYRDYNSEDLLNDMYPLEGSLTPQPMMRTPSPLRPKSKASDRPRSRYDVCVQGYPTYMTEARSRPVPNATQQNYAIPETYARPTSPVARLLNRYPSAPSRSHSGAEMDPITRQYYNRMWKAQAPSMSVNLNRQGRAGGVWRHVRACVANTGTQLAFIDGTVKEEDNVYFPPFKKTSGMSQYPAYVTLRRPPRPHAASARASYNTRFNAHAKEGFKYWYQEPKPIDLRGDTTRLRARMVGNGY